MRISKVKELKRKRIIILHSGAPRPNRGLIELELILQILRENNLRPEIFFAYFPYGMQDKAFEKGEINVSKNLISKLVDFYKVKKIYIVDAHFAGREWIKKYPIINISALPVLTKIAKKEFGQNIFLLSPDLGGERRTKIVGFEKKRVSPTRVKIFSKKLNLKGKIIAVVDDMIKTGNTLLKFYDLAKILGAKKIIALVSHGVIPSAVTKIKKKYFRLYLTNTIKQKGETIDLTDLILKTINKYDRS